MASAPPEIAVAAGIVAHGGAILIAQRPTSAHLGGLWEFPGGKKEPGETWERCLIRELREELAIDVAVQSLYWETRHPYPDRVVHLRFFLCDWIGGEPAAIECAQFRWVKPTDLRRYTFPPADAPLLARVAALAL